jgi:hypothetical protein
MTPKIAAATAILFATGACLTGTVMAGGSGNNAASVTPASAEEVPSLSQAHFNGLTASGDPSAQPPLTIDIPVNGTIYPPDIIPPQFAWRDDNPAATVWRIEIAFGEHTRPSKSGRMARRCSLPRSIQAWWVMCRRTDPGTGSRAYLAARRKDLGGDQAAFRRSPHP